MIIAAASFFLLYLLGVAFLAHRSRALHWLNHGGTVALTKVGFVEYAQAGSGPAILLLHGGVGGWDQGISLAVGLLSATDELFGYHRALQEADKQLRGRFTVIAPSRAGYLRTPLASGRSPAEGADAMAALLDALRLQQVVVIGVSGGGPTALQFALRHPQRCTSLAMVAAIAQRHVQPPQTTENLVGKVVFWRGFGWLADMLVTAVLAVCAIHPMFVAKKLLEATEKLDFAGIGRRLSEIRRSPFQIEWMKGLLRSAYPLSVRRVGLANDLDQFARIDDYPVERIACPTLVVHGRHDGNVPFAHAEYVAHRVPGAELVVAETCGHLLWVSEDASKIRHAVVDFLDRQASNTR